MDFYLMKNFTSKPMLKTNVSTKHNDVNPMLSTNWNDNLTAQPQLTTTWLFKIEILFLDSDLFYFHPALHHCIVSPLS